MGLVATSMTGICVGHLDSLELFGGRIAAERLFLRFVRLLPTGTSSALLLLTRSVF